MTVKLGFNIDHIATIREARKICEPDPIAAAVLAELAGASGITVHLREDKQHIQDRDVQLLRRTVTTKMNLEIFPSQEMVQVAINNQPDTVTLVPETHTELSTEDGLKNRSRLRRIQHRQICDQLRTRKCRRSGTRNLGPRRHGRTRTQVWTQGQGRTRSQLP